MDLLAPISRNVIAPLWAAWERRPYLRHYRRMLGTQYEPVEVIRERETEAIRVLASYAVAKVPFWRNRFAQAGVAPNDLRSLDDLRRLPLLTKADLRAHLDDMLSPDYVRDRLHKQMTSGSTGVSVVTFRDDACEQFKHGATCRANEWSGWRRGERIASIWGNPQVRLDWRGRLRRTLLNRCYVYLDTLRMDETAMSDFADTLERTPPSMLFGHAHSLYLFASYLKAKRPEVRIRPRGILSTCMVLHRFERETIEKVFQRRVTNRYGCEEVGLIACECEQHDGLHVNADCLYVEIIDQQGNACPPGKQGRIVVTDLLNRAMPMFRYEVGDAAAWANEPCSCGRTLPMLDTIEGRVADYVITARGEYISGISLTENFAVMVPGVAQWQIVQEDVNRFCFRIVKGADFGSASLEKISSLVAERFGDGVQFECEFVDRIALEPSGKYRFCISKVAKPFP